MLSHENPCYQCPKNCCNPLVVGYPKQIGFPLPKGGCSSELLQDAVVGIKDLIKRFIDEIVEYPEDDRFSVKGIILWPTDTSDSEIEIFPIQNMLFTALRLKVVVDCAVFDREHGICTRYDTRPDICQNFSIETCGLSKVAKLKYKADGTVFTISEIVEENRRLLLLIQPTIDEVVTKMFDEIRSYRP